MPGPMPKDQAVRQRTNKASTRAELSTAAGKRRRVPRLPERMDDTGQVIPWHVLTLAWWKDVWKSPMASEYLKADQHSLYRLAVLVDKFWVKPTKDLAAEIAHEQQAFGLTPLDRRRLEWSVVQTEEAKARQGRAKPPKPDIKPGEDPRRMLSIV